MIRAFLRLFPYVRGLEDELECERMRLAACGVAALGYFTGCKEEYRSASLDDVLRLWKKYDELVRPQVTSGLQSVCVIPGTLDIGKFR